MGSCGIRLRMRVVLPEPRKPVTIVIGIMLKNYLNIRLGTINSGVERMSLPCQAQMPK